MVCYVDSKPAKSGHGKRHVLTETPKLRVEWQRPSPSEEEMFSVSSRQISQTAFVPCDIFGAAKVGKQDASWVFHHVLNPAEIFWTAVWAWLFK